MYVCMYATGTKRCCQKPTTNKKLYRKSKTNTQLPPLCVHTQTHTQAHSACKITHTNAHEENFQLPLFEFGIFQCLLSVRLPVCTCTRTWTWICTCVCVCAPLAVTKKVTVMSGIFLSYMHTISN